MAAACYFLCGTTRCGAHLQGTQTLGQYMVGDVLTTKETILSWTGIAILFFVVLVPTTNQTILAYFTSEVSCIAWLSITASPTADTSIRWSHVAQRYLHIRCISSQLTATCHCQSCSEHHTML